MRCEDWLKVLSCGAQQNGPANKSPPFFNKLENIHATDSSSRQMELSSRGLPLLLCCLSLCTMVPPASVSPQSVDLLWIPAQCWSRVFDTDWRRHGSQVKARSVRLSSLYWSEFLLQPRFHPISDVTLISFSHTSSDVTVNISVLGCGLGSNTVTQALKIILFRNRKEKQSGYLF